MTDDDEDVVAILAVELLDAGPVEVVWTAASAFQMCGIVQLALRHPGVADNHNLRQVAEVFLAHMRTHFVECPMVIEVLRRGDDPTEDR